MPYPIHSVLSSIPQVLPVDITIDMSSTYRANPLPLSTLLKESILCPGKERTKELFFMGYEAGLSYMNTHGVKEGDY